VVKTRQALRLRLAFRVLASEVPRVLARAQGLVAHSRSVLQVPPHALAPVQLRVRRERAHRSAPTAERMELRGYLVAPPRAVLEVPPGLQLAAAAAARPQRVRGEQLEPSLREKRAIQRTKPQNP
jgi:hypothetical protein